MVPGPSLAVFSVTTYGQQSVGDQFKVDDITYQITATSPTEVEVVGYTGRAKEVTISGNVELIGLFAFEDKIKTFLNWWESNGFPFELVPDQANLKLENAGKLPSWRRICKCIIKND
ncbi:hypothetical protein QQ020_23225 [Fulvivirgaceae bacterium BMA12]|uniref:Uncharacterized protein n=1 Tax=Agaribacillus aureus TaxID=3051825 RepID=A0ABT8LDH1_9BACT|nr:hypothetical protein [Fulvivirgaceae bacterium BMA12]